MSNPEHNLAYLVPALELLKLLTSLTQRYAEGQFTDEQFKSAWAYTVQENSEVDAIWLAKVGQAVS